MPHISGATTTRDSTFRLHTQYGPWLYEAPNPNPFAYHLLNLLFHFANTVLVMLLLREYLHAGRPSPNKRESDWLIPVAGALFFAIHPLQAEPVAWISSLKDLASGFFALLALWLYAQSTRDETPHASIGSLLLKRVPALIVFVLAMLGKPSTVSIIFFVAISEYYIYRRTANFGHEVCTATGHRLYSATVD